MIRDWILKTHDHVIKWKFSSHYWPFVEGIHRWPVDSLHKIPVMRGFDISYNISLNKLLDHDDTVIGRSDIHIIHII